MFKDSGRCEICNKTLVKTLQYGGMRWEGAQEVQGDLLCDNCFEKIRPAYNRYLQASRELGMEIIMARKRADVVR